MTPSLLDRFVCVLSYFTFGIFSIIWLIFANLTKKTISQFVMFNLMQAIFLSVVLSVISILFDIAINILGVIPFVGKIANWLNIAINYTPMYFSFTLSGLFVALLVIYLSVFCFFGKKPYLPFISKILGSYFGG